MIVRALRVISMIFVSSLAIQTSFAQVFSDDSLSGQGKVNGYNSISLIPHRIVETYNLLIADAQDQDGVVSGQKICAINYIIQGLMYGRNSDGTHGSQPIYPRSIQGKYAAQYSNDIASLDVIYSQLSTLAKVNDCAVKNNKCCDKTGATEKCKTKFGKECTITGSVDSCASGSDNCPQPQ